MGKVNNLGLRLTSMERRWNRLRGDPSRREGEVSRRRLIGRRKEGGEGDGATCKSAGSGCQYDLIKAVNSLIIEPSGKTYSERPKEKKCVAAGIRAQVSTATTWNSHH